MEGSVVYDMHKCNVTKSQLLIPHLKGTKMLTRPLVATSQPASRHLCWKTLLMRTWEKANEDRLTSVAGSVAFFSLLALVPALSVIVSIYGLFTEPSNAYQQIGAIASYLPDGGQQIIEEQVKRLTSQPRATLSFNLLMSLLIAGWSANAAIKGLFDGLNAIYNETEKRSFFKFNAISLTVTLGAILLLIIAMFVIAIAPALIQLIPYAKGVQWLIGILRWPLFLCVAVGAINFLYWIGPCRPAVQLASLLPGSLFAAVMWAGVSGGFSWYVSTLGNYTATYGSLSTVIVFMTWLWLSATAILLGAAFNFEVEQQTLKSASPMEELTLIKEPS
jgi:membrane protein